MGKRGKILRDPVTGPGLLIVEGQQFSFLPQGIWKSDIPPKPGLLVDIEFDSAECITAITAVSEAQLGSEQCEVANHIPRGVSPGFVITGISRMQLSAATVLLLSWSYLTAVSVQIPLLGELKFSFWQLLSHLNTGNMLSIWERPDDPGTGLYGFIAILALAGPFLPYLWKDRRASIGAFLPLVFLSFVGFMIRRVVVLPSETGGYTRLSQVPVFNSVSFGAGAYLSTFISLYFAVSCAKQLLKRPTRVTNQFEQSQNAAA